MTFSNSRTQPPGDRDTILRLTGHTGQSIYGMVRGILNEAEAATPWALLYYPPEEREAFIEIGHVLIQIVSVIPSKVEQLLATLTATPGQVDEETLDNIQFFFNGIHTMTAPELEKLRGRLDLLSGPDGPDLYTQQERDYICEVSADLKGKYLSSIMGAAASLIAEGRWDGVEIEPILFPEKREEFDRNRQLVQTLQEVIDSTRRLPEEVSLAQLVENWRQRRRVDQYALTPLYSFLGILGKLMKESSRRALYSGDYHQIRKRERQVSQKINELSMLHNATWTGAEPPVAEDPFVLMEQRACEIAALLNIDMLREILGDSAIQTLRQVVVTASDRLLETYEPRPGLLPSWWRSLLPILQDDDLRTFFDLLLGSVMKRASLQLDAKRQVEAEQQAEQKARQAEEWLKEAQVQASVGESAVPAELAAPAGGQIPGPGPAAEPAAAVPPPADEMVTIDTNALSFDLPEDAFEVGTAAGTAESPPDGGDFFIPIDFDAVDALDNAVRPPDPIAESTEVRPPEPRSTPAPLEFDLGAAAPPLDSDPVPPALSEPATGDLGFLGDGLSEGYDLLEGNGFLEGHGLPENTGLPGSHEGMPGTPSKGLEGFAATPPSGAASNGERLEALGRLRMSLRELTASHNAHRRQFDFLQSLLGKKKLIPPSMLQSIYPFLDDVMESLAPQVEKAVTLGVIGRQESEELIGLCQDLRSGSISPQQLRQNVSPWMLRLVELLADFEARIDNSMAEPTMDASSFFGSPTGSFLR